MLTFIRKSQEKTQEAKSAATNFDNWYKTKSNSLNNFSQLDAFNLWFYEVDKGKKSNSRYDRVRKAVLNLKKNYDVVIQFSEADHSESSRVDNGIIDYKNWIAITKAGTGRSDIDFDFWFFTYYNKYNNCDYNTYQKIIEQTNQKDAFNSKVMKTEFKPIPVLTKEDFESENREAKLKRETHKVIQLKDQTELDNQSQVFSNN